MNQMSMNDDSLTNTFYRNKSSILQNNKYANKNSEYIDRKIIKPQFKQVTIKIKNEKAGVNYPTSHISNNSIESQKRNSIINQQSNESLGSANGSQNAYQTIEPEKEKDLTLPYLALLPKFYDMRGNFYQNFQEMNPFYPVERYNSTLESALNTQQ